VALIPPEVIEQIEAANDIVEVIGGYFPLKRAGGLYKALCPFHQERTPSFSVNPQRQIFKCFGCGVGGGVLRFVMNYEHLEFIPAVKKLAERAGIPLQENEFSAEDNARLQLRRRLLGLHAATAEFFHHQLLKKPAAQIARDYLKSRGITSDTAKRWKLGFAPAEGDALLQFARHEGYTEEELRRGGLAKPRFEDQPDGPVYGTFRSRVMFPINNETGETIAFSGRVLDPLAKTAKYVNSPETMLFTKGAVLFGLDRSKRALADKKTAIVCEGQLDLITAFEAGIENVIAPQGTAFTPKQAHILRRFVDEVILCFDSDAAGQKAAERSLPSLLAENLSVRVAQLPQGHDPDSLIRGEGSAAFSDRINAARDYFAFQLETLAAQPEFATPRGKTSAARKIAESLSLITDSILREAEMQRAAVRLEIPTQEFANLIKPIRRTSPHHEATQQTKDEQEEAQEVVLQDATIRLLTLVALTDSGARAWILEEPWSELLANETEAGILLKALCADLHPENTASLTGFLTTLSQAEESAVSGLLEQRTPELPLVVAQDCWREVERRQIRRRMASVESRLRMPGIAIEDVIQLQKQILDLKNRLSDIARPLSSSL